jgi:hypothetical protein
MAKYPIMVHGGDLRKGKGFYYHGWFSKKIYLRGFLFWKKRSVNDIDTIEIITDDMVKGGMGKVGSAAVGTLLLGPLGLIAGAIIGGKQKKEITFVVEFSDGKSFIASSDVPTFQKLKGVALNARRRIPARRRRYED